MVAPEVTAIPVLELTRIRPAPPPPPPEDNGSWSHVPVNGCPGVPSGVTPALPTPPVLLPPGAAVVADERGGVYQPSCPCVVPPPPPPLEMRPPARVTVGASRRIEPPLPAPEPPLWSPVPPRHPLP